jgi:hypothetical protein
MLDKSLKERQAHQELQPERLLALKEGETAWTKRTQGSRQAAGRIASSRSVEIAP